MGDWLIAEALREVHETFMKFGLREGGCGVSKVARCVARILIERTLFSCRIGGNVLFSISFRSRFGSSATVSLFYVLDSSAVFVCEVVSVG
jgi:hypothetical protein